MSFQDISPPNQPFNHAFRPFSFCWENDGENTTICTIIYGFGEYQFSANLKSYNSKEDFSRLQTQLQTGEIPSPVRFQTSEDVISLHIRGVEDWLTFEWVSESSTGERQLLAGETSRQQLLAFIKELKAL